eukprot:CAMPEP_0202736096 /NCGR_PEP_ID=MMETSP1388-20130828/792_1 /ASSEMBLY_ACC=CAM_ASM_000864 /TAXON_ID=37098 /ORGANISM="Isochrysis sp, Strain CCMP1244" /LENGTH=249 /DNA_ID=CAMNT_0049402575 /DNA_START=171 /DNA_END=917 /DNA_ORIENTATION=+
MGDPESRERGPPKRESQTHGAFAEMRHGACSPRRPAWRAPQPASRVTVEEGRHPVPVVRVARLLGVPVRARAAAVALPLPPAPALPAVPVRPFGVGDDCGERRSVDSRVLLMPHARHADLRGAVLHRRRPRAAALSARVARRPVLRGAAGTVPVRVADGAARLLLPLLPLLPHAGHALLRREHRCLARPPLAAPATSASRCPVLGAAAAAVPVEVADLASLLLGSALRRRAVAVVGDPRPLRRCAATPL